MLILNSANKDTLPEPVHTGITVNSLEGDIVFMSRADEPSGELYLMNKTGYITRLTNNSRYENNPAFSSDRKKIAFQGGVESDYSSWEIFVIDLSTGIETQITNNNVLDGHPDWSPDDKKLVYASFQDLNGKPVWVADIFVYDFETRKNVRITTNPGEDNDPEWSPDGNKIIIKATSKPSDKQKEEIYVIDSDGSNRKQLTFVDGWYSDHDASWSPDSDSVVYERFEGSVPWNKIADTEYFINNYEEFLHWNIFSVDLNGTEKRLTNSSSISFLPVYSPNGEEIMYIDMQPIFVDGKLTGLYKYLVVTDPNGVNHTKIVDKNWPHIFSLEYFDW